MFIDAGFGELPNKYLGLIRLSPSKITMFRKSPQHYIKRHLRPPSKKAELGTNFHLALLQPELWKEKFVVMPDFPKKSKDQPLTIKDQQIAWKQERPDSIVVKPEELEVIERMVESCLENQSFMSLFKGELLTECKFWSVYDCQGTLVVINGVPDIINLSIDAVLDAKSTTTANFRSWTNRIVDNELHIQAAIYLDALSVALKRTLKDFVWTVCESTWPWISQPYYADFGMLEAGREATHETIFEMIQAHKQNKFIGYFDDIQPIALPHWAFTKYSNEIEQKRAERTMFDEVEGSDDGNY